MFCKNCGIMIPSGSQACPRCGTAASAAGTGKLRIQMDGQTAQTPNVPREAPAAPAQRTFCPHCGAKNVAGGPFCAACGQQLRRSAPVAAAPVAAAPTQSPARKSSRGLKIGLLVGGLCLVLLLGAFLVYKLVLAGDKPEKAPEAPQEGADISGPFREPEEITTSEEALPELADGQILSRGDMAATFSYADRIVETENLAGSYLYDMDGDNVCELILKTGRSEADAMFYFYSYYDGYLHQLGSLSAGHSALYVQDDVLILQYGHMGYEQVTELTLRGERILTNCVLDRQLADGEDYTEFSQRPYSSEGDDLSVLSHVYVKSEKQIVNTDTLFTTADAYDSHFFTDGAHGYAQLSDGRVLAVDAETGEIAVVATVDAEATLFAATKKRLYFQVDHYWEDGPGFWGKDVFSCSVYGGDYQMLEGAWDLRYQDGIILMTSYHSDVSPIRITAIDSEDRTFISDVWAWDATICNGAVYYGEEVMKSERERDNTTMRLYRAQGTEKTYIANIPLDQVVSLDGSYARIYVYHSDGTTTEYDLYTGARID